MNNSRVDLPRDLGTAHSYSHAEKREAVIRCAVFWLGFFASLMLARVLSGFVVNNQGAGLSQAAGQWMNGILMVCLSLLWTQVCVRMERGRRLETGTRFSGSSMPRMMAGLAFAIPFSAAALLSIKLLVPGVQFTRTDSGALAVLGAVALLVLLATYEEIGFRGYPLRRLLQVFGPWTALFLIAPIFVLYHLWMGWHLLPALVVAGTSSMLFGVAAIVVPQDLAFPIGVHAGWNFAAWLLNGAAASGMWTMIFPPGETRRVQAAQMGANVLCMLLAAALLWWWSKRESHRAEVWRQAAD